jgi:hypothetical protein
MYIAFSALSQSVQGNHTQNNLTTLNEHEVLQRLDGYKAACEKYKDEIASIQKYIPGWMPAFNR